MTGYWESLAIPVVIDAIAVLGLYVIISSGRISVGHAAFFGVGAYASGLLSTGGMPPPASIALGVIVAFLVGAVFSAVAERLAEWFFAIATLAFGIMLSALASSLDAVGGATGLYGVPLFVDLPVALICLCAAIAMVVWIDASSFGRAARALRDNEVAAEALAINPARVRILAFAIGAGLAGLAGGLWSHYLGLVKPGDISLDRSILYLVYLCVGGVDYWLGALLGTFVLGLLPEALRFSHQYRLALFGALLAGVMILRPRGLMPRPRFRPPARS